MKKAGLIWVLVLGTLTGFGQSLTYTREVTEKLCSPEFFGRGYVHSGDRVAAEYIASELKKNRVKPLVDAYIQPYTMRINSQPKAKIWLNGTELEPDGSWLIEASSPTLQGEFPVIPVDPTTLNNPRLFIREILQNPNPVYLLDSAGLGNPVLYSFAKELIASPVVPSIALVEVMHRAPFGIVRKNFDPYVKIQLGDNHPTADIQTIRIENDNRYIEEYPTQNVCGFVPGRSDEWVVFTGHYDGEGMYGEVLFPAANDNASGTAMGMDLARHYASGKKPFYNMAFLLVSGEEAGLLGSTYFTNHPLIPMDKIRMVINLDMVATGENGVMLFNGETWPIERDVINRINTEKGYMPLINSLPPAANSDHHPFHVKGVPAIFFITMGKAGPAHTAYDYADSLLWPKYNELFSLITDFVTELPSLPEPVRYPLVDYHVHLKGDLTYEKAVELSAETGINFGVAVNCGVGFPVNSYKAAIACLEGVKDSPFMLGMQAEGREWVSTFSQEVIDRFDYVFTDAMTYFNEAGERVRLWIPEEVSITNTEQFMDELCGRIVKIVQEEPIDIYVNSTFLPAAIADQYESLWTPARMDQVIQALVDSGVAMEINNRYRIPSATFIKRAKAAGVKFTFGTNNTDSQLGNLDYCRQMVTECRLINEDLWQNKKKVSRQQK